MAPKSSKDLWGIWSLKCGFCLSTRPDAMVLNEVSFSIEPNQVVALVGPSGGGKSTVAALISRFYDVDGGDINLMVNLYPHSIWIGFVSTLPLSDKNPFCSLRLFWIIFATEDHLQQTKRSSKPQKLRMPMSLYLPSQTPIKRWWEKRGSA